MFAFPHQVGGSDHREYGHARVSIKRFSDGPASSSLHVDALFEGLGDELEVWMSHGDALSKPPPNFHVIGHTTNAPFAAIAHDDSAKKFYAIQFHPEVRIRS